MRVEVLEGGPPIRYRLSLQKQYIAQMKRMIYVFGLHNGAFEETVMDAWAEVNPPVFFSVDDHDHWSGCHGEEYDGKDPLLGRNVDDHVMRVPAKAANLVRLRYM